MVLYGLPEGAFENRQNNKDPAGIVVVWEATSCQSARPGRQQRTALVLVHLPCYAWVEAGVTLPLISFSSFEILFMAHLIITQYIFSVLFDTGELCHRYRCCDRRQKTAFGFKIWNTTRYVSCTGNTRVVLCGGADPFVGGVSHLSELRMDCLDLWALAATSAETKDYDAHFWPIC